MHCDLQEVTWRSEKSPKLRAWPTMAEMLVTRFFISGKGISFCLKFMRFQTKAPKKQLSQVGTALRLKVQVREWIATKRNGRQLLISRPFRFEI